MTIANSLYPIFLKDFPLELLTNIYTLLPDQGDKAAFEKTSRKFYYASLNDSKKPSYIMYFNCVLRSKEKFKENADLIFQLFMKNDLLIKGLTLDNRNRMQANLICCNSKKYISHEGISVVMFTCTEIELARNKKRCIKIINLKGKTQEYPYMLQVTRLSTMSRDISLIKELRLSICKPYQIQKMDLSWEEMFKKIIKSESKSDVISDLLNLELNTYIDFIADQNIQILSSAIKNLDELPSLFWCTCHRVGIGLIKEIKSHYNITTSISFKIVTIGLQSKKRNVKILVWNVNDYSKYPTINQGILYAILSKTTQGFSKFLKLDLKEEVPIPVIEET